MPAGTSVTLMTIVREVTGEIMTFGCQSDTVNSSSCLFSMLTVSHPNRFAGSSKTQSRSPGCAPRAFTVSNVGRPRSISLSS